MEAKKCRKCGSEKSIDQFYVRRDTGKWTSECRDCKRERSIAHFNANKARHKELVAIRYRNFGRFQRYGLTEDDYRELLAKQGGTCALCGAIEPGGKGKWHIDHVHSDEPVKTFKQCEKKDVRGLLCHTCNISLGHYEKLKAEVGEKTILGYLGLISLE
jgi:hypothetical protein